MAAIRSSALGIIFTYHDRMMLIVQ